MKKLLTLMLMAILSITVCACSINQENLETTLPSETEVQFEQATAETPTEETESLKTENEILLSNYIAELKKSEKRWIVYDMLINKSDKNNSMSIQIIMQRDKYGNVIYQTIANEELIPEKSFCTSYDSNGFYGIGENEEEIASYDICTVRNIIEAHHVMPKRKYITYLNNIIENKEFENIQSEEAEFHGKDCKMLTITLNSNYFNFVNPDIMNFIYTNFVEQFRTVPEDNGTPIKLNLYFDKDSMECLGQRIRGPFFLYPFALGDKTLEKQMKKGIDFVIDMQFMAPEDMESKNENQEAVPRTLKMLMEDTLSVDADGEYIQIDTNYDIIMSIIHRGLMVCKDGDQIANLYPMYYRSLFHDALTNSKTNKLFKIEKDELDIPGKRANLFTYITEQGNVYSYVLVVAKENDPMGVALVGADKDDLVAIAKDMNLKTSFKKDKTYFDLMPFAEPINDLTEDLNINKEVSESERENKETDSVSINALINELKEYAKTETFDYIFSNQMFEGNKNSYGNTFRRVMDENGTLVILGQFDNNTRASISVHNGERYIHYVTADIENPKWERFYRINESNGTNKTVVVPEHIEMLDKLNSENRLTLLDDTEIFKGVECYVITTELEIDEYIKIEPVWGYSADFFLDPNDDISLKIYFSKKTHQLIGEVERIDFLNSSQKERSFIAEYVYYPDPEIIDIPDFVQYEDNEEER